MSYVLTAFLEKRAALSENDLAAEVREGEFFDADPDIKWEARSGDDWRSAEVHYARGTRPILLWHVDSSEASREVVEEASRDLATSRDTPAVRTVRHALEHALDAISLEFTSENLPEEAWELLGHLEAHFLKSWGGVIYAPHDGFFILQDGVLKKAVKL